jgi:hypothetical protein
MAQDEETPSLELYGSIRLHTNYVTVDEASRGEDDDFIGLSDAYSRLGAALRLGDDDIKITARYEVNVNSADLEFGDPSFFDDEDSRLYSVKAETKYGTFLVGKDWLPYYNNVGYPVDYFSSVYAGYTTYAFFREKQIAYTTPTLNGFSSTLARIERTGGGPKGWHYALSYSKGGLSLAAGREDMDGDVADTQGFALSYSKGPWYLASKYENSDAFGDIINGFIQYNQDKFTYKFGLGLGDQFSGDTYHLGLDYKMTESFKLFTEFYAEENNYALLRNDAQSANDYFGAGGFGTRQNGKALLAGFRVDFSTHQ